jgi:hypothetical protein
MKHLNYSLFPKTIEAQISDLHTKNLLIQILWYL